MRLSFFLILQIAVLCNSSVFAQEKRTFVEIPNTLFCETDPLTELKDSPEFAEKSPHLTVRVNPAPFADWELSSNREQIQTSEFLGQFSMKRGYRLEPFLRDLTPEIAVRVQCDIFQTVHEFYCESVLAPAQAWCREHGAALQFRIPALSGAQNASMILDEAQFATEIYVDGFQSLPTTRLAASIVLSRGFSYVATDKRTISCAELPHSECLILLPNKQTYDFEKEPEFYQSGHFITENELYYATIISKDSKKILGTGAEEYQTLIIHPAFEKVYTPATIRVIDRFRTEGLRIE